MDPRGIYYPYQYFYHPFIPYSNSGVWNIQVHPLKDEDPLQDLGKKKLLNPALEEKHTDSIQKKRKIEKNNGHSILKSYLVDGKCHGEASEEDTITGSVTNFTFVDDVRQGEATKIFKMGGKTDFFYEANIPHGLVTRTTAKGNVIKGFFNRGKAEGNITVKFKNKDFSILPCKEGKVDGVATKHFKNGNELSIPFVKGKREGVAFQKFFNGDVVSCLFVNDILQNEGTLNSADGTTIQGTFESDPSCDLTPTLVLPNANYRLYSFNLKDLYAN